MGKLYNIKVLGKARAMIKRSHPEQISVQYDTTIYSNNADNEFIKKLAKLGFHIVSFNTKYLRVMLPVGWSHIRISKDEEVILDEKSRARLGVSRKMKLSILYRRYDFMVQVASAGEEEDKKYNVITHLTDQSQPFEEFTYDHPTLVFTELLTHAKNDDDVAEAFKIVMSDILDARFPEWQNELAYWDEEE